MERALRLPGVAETVDIDHIKAGYYSIKALNPSGIVPVGPENVVRLIASLRAS
jgi:putative glutathione S-transferase